MKILNNNFCVNKFPDVNNKKMNSYSNVINGDTFIRSTPVSFKAKINLNPILDKNYSDMTEEEKNILRQELDPTDNNVINDCIKTAGILKAAYDEKYGENNWEYIAIGRSCATIATTLKALGIKTYILPISGLQKGISNGEELIQQDGFNSYRQFIYDQGLTPDNIQNSGKTYIFQDYSDTGTSMRIFEEFIRSPEMNLDKDNVIFESINDTLCNNIYKIFTLKIKDYNPLTFLQFRLASQFHGGSLKSYTGTPKLHYKDLKDIEFIKDQKPITMYRLFNFGLEDKVKSGKD